MRKNLPKILGAGILLLVLYAAWPEQIREQTHAPEFPRPVPFLQADSLWVDSMLASLSLEEQIGQMMMIQAYSNMGESHERSIRRQVERYGVGGLAFFQGDPLTQARLTNRYQEASDIPLLIAMDGENGLGMRLKNTIRYPQLMALGAIQDPELLFRLGQDMGLQMKRLGVHLNFAPVADVNNNPANPVINTRSFGEDPRRVARQVVAITSGLQAAGMLVAAKHFPGHGDTDADSHHALPILPYERGRLDSIELLPFREAISHGLTGIMVAHLEVPAIESASNRPASVSSKLVNGLLKEELGFQGLIITDALNMKGLSQHLEPGLREVEAVKAGNDILLMPSDVELAIREIKRAVRRGEISEERIRNSCRKILRAKYWAGLAGKSRVELQELEKDLHQEVYYSRYRELVSATMTLVRNRDSLLPLKHLDQLHMATVSISRSGELHFGATSDLYLSGDHFTLRSRATEAEQQALLKRLESYNLLVVHVLNTSSFASRNFGITSECIDFVSRLPRDARLVLNLAGYPYALGRFPDLDHVDALVLSYSDQNDYQAFVQQAIFGGRSFRGRMPVSWEGKLPAGWGMDTGDAQRLGYASPLDQGLHPDTLQGMEEIIREAMAEKAMPGCQVLVARRGKVVWHQSYGHHSYRRRRAVQNSDLYDLASLTKIFATVPALMRLREQGRFHEDSALGAYLEFPDSSNKAALVMADILSHQAGLQAWIPFYFHTLEPLYPSQQLVRHNPSAQYPLKIGPSDYANKDVKYVDSVFQWAYGAQYPIEVAEHLFMHRDWRDSIYHWIEESALLSPEYRYSDLGYYYFKEIVEQASDTLLYPFVWYNFYAPLGAESLGFIPLKRFDRQQIVPTEHDLFVLKQLIHGHVHDPGAAMLGGISGHSGLFGNANDLAKMMQMFLNGGSYGSRSYLDPEVLGRYTSCYNCEGDNRRGLGFDRPVVDEPGEGPACDSASALSYGHSGFTGTLAWVDPQEELLFVFLSNRIHPGQGNTRLIEDNVRTRVQQVLYDALLD